MTLRLKFSTEDSVKIVEWWCKLKDIHKVWWWVSLHLTTSCGNLRGRDPDGQAQES